MSNKTVVNNNGIGFLGLLTLIFVGLKLAEIGVVATWSWWWVLSPLWIPLALFAAVMFVALVCIVIKHIFLR